MAMDIKLASEQSFAKMRQVLRAVRERLDRLISTMPGEETYQLRWMRGVVKEVDAIVDGERIRMPGGTIKVKLRPLAVRLSDKIPIIPVWKAGVRDGAEQIGIYRQFPLLDKKAIAFLEDYKFGLIKDVTETMRERIKSQVRLGLIQGEGIPQITRRLAGRKGVLANARYRAERIARTELARAHTEGRRYCYKESGIKKVEVIGKGVDCPICSDYIGQAYKIDEAPHLPFHPNCECDIVAVV